MKDSLKLFILVTGIILATLLALYFFCAPAALIMSFYIWPWVVANYANLFVGSIALICIPVIIKSFVETVKETKNNISFMSTSITKEEREAVEKIGFDKVKLSNHRNGFFNKKKKKRVLNVHHVHQVHRNGCKSD